MEILIPEYKIERRVRALAHQISEEHKASGNSLPPVMICVLNGGYAFFADLMKDMGIDVQMDFIRAKSYEGQDNSGGVKITESLMIKIGRNLLILLFAFFQIIFLISLIRFFFNKKTDSFYFIIFSQIYLFVVSFVNISTVRYLMPVYPIIILACLIFLNEVVKKKNVFSTRY